MAAAGVRRHFVENADSEYRKQGTRRISAGKERETDQRMDGGRHEHETHSPDQRGNQGVSGHTGNTGLGGLQGASMLRILHGRKLAGGFRGSGK